MDKSPSRQAGAGSGADEPRTGSQSLPRTGAQLDYRGPASGPVYEQWREEFGRRLMAVDFAPLAPGSIRRTTTPRRLPGMRLSRSVGTPIKFKSTGANDDLVIVTSGSPLQAVMGRREARIAAGAPTLGDASIAGAFHAQGQGGAFNTLLIDRALLLGHCPGAERAVGTELACDAALRTLFDGYCRMAVAQTPELDALAQDALSRHLLDLVLLMLGGSKDDLDLARQRGLAAARFEAIKADVLAALADPHLSLDTLAARHRISRRYVQRLFERAGISFTGFVLEQRLLRIARQLAAPATAGRQISDLAYHAGFNDLSYFNLCFRRRFGMTPSEFRAAAVERAQRGSDLP